MSNSAIGRKTHAPDSYLWQPLPWFCLLMWRLWTIQATSVATVEWQQEWQRSNSRSVGRLRWSGAIVERQRSDSSGSKSMMSQVDWQGQQRFDLPSFQVSNTDNFLSLSWVAVFFYYCFHPVLFVCCMKYYQYCDHKNKLVPTVH